MDINSDILGGKLLLSNNDNNLSNDYKFISSDYTNYDMYYTYIEAIVPTQHLETYSEDGTATPLQIDIGKNSDISIDIYKDNICGYNLDVNNNKLNFELYDGPNFFKNTISTNEYLVLNIMILPKLNFDDSGVPSNPHLENIESNSIKLLINGKDIGFIYENDSFTGRTNILRIKQFYDKSDNFSELFKVPKIPNKCYVIWNTEYERFMYKNLANMCYLEDQKYNINVNDIKKDFLSTTNSEIYLNSDACKTKNKFFPNWDNLFLSNNFLNDDNNPIKLFIELKIPRFLIYKSLEDEIFGGYYLYISLAKLKENINIFDIMYYNKNSSYDYKEFGLDKDIISVNEDIQPYLFNIIGNNLDFIKEYSINWTGNEINDNTYCYADYMIALNKNDNNLHEYIGFYEQKDNTEEKFEVPVTFYDIGIINIEEGNYFPYINIDSISNNQDNYLFHYQTANFGESKFHIIPDMYSTDSTEYKQLYRSIENSNWKSLWKYKRTLQFTTFLQDNPVIFPLDLIKDSSSNFFLEIITTRNNNSLLEFALGSGIEFYNKNDNAVFKTLTSGIYHCEYIDNSEYQTNSSGTEQINGIKFVKTDSTTGTFGEKEYSYYDKIAFYYNKNTDNENIYVLIIQNGNTVNQLGKVPVSNLLPLKNIMVHLRPRDINNATAGTDLGTITINFGYNSDYFQDYIDELLKQDELPDTKYHKTNIFKNHNYHVLTPYFGYDMDNDVIAGYDKGVWK